MAEDHQTGRRDWALMPLKVHPLLFPASSAAWSSPKLTELNVWNLEDREHRETLEIHRPQTAWLPFQGRRRRVGFLPIPFGKTEAEMPVRGTDPQRRGKRERGRGLSSELQNHRELPQGHVPMG